MKKIVCFLLLVIMATASYCITISATDSSPITFADIYIDGESLNTSAIVYKNEMIVGMLKDICNHTDISFTYDSVNKTATISDYGVYLYLDANNGTMSRNSIATNISYISDSTSDICASYNDIFPCFGYTVKYDSQHNIVNINNHYTIQTVKWNDNYTYVGEVLNGIPFGFGELYRNTNWTVCARGKFKNTDFLEGSQTIVLADGSYITETGSFSNFELHGSGSRVDSNGTVYASKAGQWVNGTLVGQGLALFSNGDSYLGNFSNGVIDGQGFYKWSQGDTYDGNWSNGYINGYGTYIWADGRKYIGMFEYGIKSGSGIFYYVDGSYIEGTFKNDLLNGYATYYYNGTSETQLYKDGKLQTTTNSSQSNTQSLDTLTIAKGFCTFSNCTNKLLSTDVNYCYQHACNEIGCVYPICNTRSRYCLYHKCSSTDCFNGQSINSNYCTIHKCMKFNCPNPKESFGIYCSLHKN